MERAAAMALVLVTCLSVATTTWAGSDEQEIVTEGRTADAGATGAEAGAPGAAAPTGPDRRHRSDRGEAGRAGYASPSRRVRRRREPGDLRGTEQSRLLEGGARRVGHARPRARHLDLARDGACRRRRREPGTQAGRSALVERLYWRSACRSRRGAALPGRAPRRAPIYQQLALR